MLSAIMEEVVGEQFGFITAPQLVEMAAAFPNCQLVIQWGGLPRERCRASLVKARIAEGEANTGDYVRGVFIEANRLDKIKELLAILN